MTSSGFCYRVLLCLKRALRIANAAQQMASATRGSSGPVTLFVEILNKSVVFDCKFEDSHYKLLVLYNLGLICELCNRYLYYFEKGNPQVTSAAIQGLVDLIKNEMQSDSANANPAPDAFFASTLRYIQFQKQKGGVLGEKYASIKV